MATRLVLASALLLAPASMDAQTGTLTEVRDFGSNPGNLRMYQYVPNGLQPSGPLVVALHGCGQKASDYDDETGWTKFADKWGFALLLPEQQRVNNRSSCFNWFNGRRVLDLFSWSERGSDQDRNEGEALSIKQMVDKMKAVHDVDRNRIYVTGLSAGGAMAAVMLAAYPEVFAGGAIIAGVPYGCAASLSEALSTCGLALTRSGSFPAKDLNPSVWGSRVRDATDHDGPWARVSIWQGDADQTVNPVNARELLEQWANVHGIDLTPEVEEKVGGHPHRVYGDASGNVLVETYTVIGAGHGTPVSPGSSEERCGTPGDPPFRVQTTICSSYYIAKFWGLDRAAGQTPRD
ncbi:MAG TPA: PHB depolymerase family esterase [Gemmatimonadales bacterium]|nr:PHB depolymerase family esterase [Gemmatimonadales bacterium]